MTGCSEAWLSRPVWNRKTASSNLAAPISPADEIGNHTNLRNWLYRFDPCAGHGDNLKRGLLPIINDAVNECLECPLSVEGKPVNPVLGFGSESPVFIVVGESSNTYEQRVGRPGAGPSGDLVNKALKANKLTPDQVYYTNAALCKMPFGAAKEKVVVKAIKCCKPRLIRELAELPNKPVLLLGKHAAQAFLSKEFKITELAGSYQKCDVDGIEREFIPTIHPTAILRKGTGGEDGGAHASDLQFWNLLFDLRKAARLGAGTEIIKQTSIAWEAFNKKRGERLIESACRAARLVGRVSFDTETRGVAKGDCLKCPHCDGHEALEPMHARLTAIGLGTPDFAVSIAWSIATDYVKDMLRALLADPNITKVAHNLGYDDVVLQSHGFPIFGPIEDTLYLHHSAFPGLSHRLQRVVTQFSCVPPWKAEHKKQEGRDGIEGLLQYNAQDVLGTARTEPILQDCVKQIHAEKTYATDLRKVRIGIDMQLTGIPIDLERNKIFSEYFQPIIEQSRTELLGKMEDGEFKQNFLDTLAAEQAKRIRKKDSDEYLSRHALRLADLEEDFDELNLNASDQIIAFLKACNVPLSATTKKGKLSTKKEVLESLIGHPVVRQLLKFRGADKLFNTFVAPVRQAVDFNHRMHAVWSPNKITGRYGSSPNEQNWTKGDDNTPKKYTDWLALFQKYGPDKAHVPTPNLRWQVVAPPGRVFVSADYKALEARVVALLAGDAWLCEMFSNGEDIHSYFAERIFPQFASLDLHSSERSRLRDLTKRVLYAFLYGSSVLTSWKSLMKEGQDVQLSTVQKVFNFMAKRLPSIASFHNRLNRQVLETGSIGSFLHNRRRFFPLGGANQETVIKNFTAQSSGADIVDIGMIKLVDMLPKSADLLIHGHDALLVECALDDQEKVSTMFEQALVQEYTYMGSTMKFTIDKHVGNSWGEV